MDSKWDKLEGAIIALAEAVTDTAKMLVKAKEEDMVSEPAQDVCPQKTVIDEFLRAMSVVEGDVIFIGPKDQYGNKHEIAKKTLDEYWGPQ